MKFLRAAFYLVFGFLALAFGVTIIAWVLYNEFIERLPEYTHPPLMGVFGIGPVLCAVGIYWLRRPFRREDVA